MCQWHRMDQMMSYCSYKAYWYHKILIILAEFLRNECILNFFCFFQFLKSCDAVVFEERVIPCLLSRLNLGLWFICSTKGKDPLRGLWDALQDLIILVQAIRNAVELSFALCEGNDRFSPEKTLKVGLVGHWLFP